MQLGKFNILLLALLVAAMVMVAVVNAGDTSMVSSPENLAPTIDVSKIVLPDLQLEKTQNYVPVNKELSPDKNADASAFSTAEFRLH